MVLKTWVAVVIETLKSFLNLEEDNGSVANGKKIANILARRVLYLAIDYGLVLASAAIVVTMEALGFSFFAAFVILWIFDFVTACAFVVFYEKTGQDLSLGEDFRRATDTIHNRSQIAGRLTMLLIMFQAIYWNGPEQIVIFFRKEICTIYRVIGTILGLTAIQAVIWTVLYGFGYNLLERVF